MPRYVIEKQYLLPVYKHVLVEAESLEVACRSTVEEDEWEGAKEDYDGARPTTITSAVELPTDLGDPDDGDLPQLLYECGYPTLPIPDEFSTEESE